MSTLPRPVKEDQQLASFVAMVIRNAMEDFHCQHLTDDQMKELNPIIRNAVCTALHAFNNYETADAAKRFTDYNFSMIPEYWEIPELLDGYLRMWDNDDEQHHGETEES